VREIRAPTNQRDETGELTTIPSITPSSTSRHLLESSLLLEVSSGSSTANMHTHILHSTLFHSLLFLKAYFLYLALACICVRGLYRRYVSPLRQIPGPFIASCTRGWKGRDPPSVSVREGQLTTPCMKYGACTKAIQNTITSHCTGNTVCLSPPKGQTRK
jgi:hypothetical protein